MTISELSRMDSREAFPGDLCPHCGELPEACDCHWEKEADDEMEDSEWHK